MGENSAVPTILISQSALQKHYKARLVVSIIMLLTAFVGLIILDIHTRAYWFYSQIMSAWFGLLSLWLHWYVYRHQADQTSTTLWHHILHWCGLMIAVYLISIFVSTGILKTTQAGLVTLSLLSLTLFIAGVHSDIVFMLVGVTLVIFSGCAAIVQAYLFFYMVVIALMAFSLILAIILLQRRSALKHHQAETNE